MTDLYNGVTEALHRRSWGQSPVAHYYEGWEHEPRPATVEDWLRVLAAAAAAAPHRFFDWD